MPSTISRRDFLKVGGSALGTAVLSQFIPPHVAEAAHSNGLLDLRTAATSRPCAKCASGAVAFWLKLKTGVWSSWKGILSIRIPRVTCAHAVNRV